MQANDHPRDICRGHLETSRSESLLDPHIARSNELIDLGDFVAADRVRKCGAFDVFDVGLQTRYCKRRECPTCAEHLARRYGRQMFESTLSFRGGVILVGLFALVAQLDRLDEAFSRWRKAHSLLRRRVVMARNVLGGCGALEPKLTRNRRRWNLHAHVLLDARTDQIAEAEIHGQWRELTGGTFSLDPYCPTVRSRTQFSKYATKTNTWAPAPGEQTPAEYAHLRKGIRGKQLLVRWGTGIPGRKQ